MRTVMKLFAMNAVFASVATVALIGSASAYEVRQDQNYQRQNQPSYPQHSQQQSYPQQNQTQHNYPQHNYTQSTLRNTVRNYDYVYYPHQQVYYSPSSSNWFWSTGSGWQIGSRLPGNVSVDLRFGGVPVALQYDRPYVQHEYVETSYGRPWRKTHQVYVQPRIRQEYVSYAPRVQYYERDRYPQHMRHGYREWERYHDRGHGFEHR